jgi:hypothetical protein
MSEELKTALTDAILAGDNKKFGQILQTSNEQGAQSIRDSLKEINNTGGGEQTVKAVLSNIKFNLANEGALKSPQAQQATQALQAEVTRGQLELDSALRSQSNALRNFINEGANRANNTLDIRAYQTRGTYLGQQTELVQRQQSTALIGLQYGPITTKLSELSDSIRGVAIEERQRKTEIEQNLTSSVIGRLSPNFDEQLVGQLNETLKKSTIGRNIPVAQADKFVLQQVENINKGIAAVVSRGNITQFSDEHGQFNQNKFINTVSEELSNRNLSDSAINNVREWLKNNVNSAEILSDIRSAVNEEVKNSQEAIGQRNKLRAEFQGFKSILEFKSVASFLGGEKSLESREARNAIVKNITRGEALFAHGSTAEVRGQGAALILRQMQAEGRPIDVNEPTGHIAELVKAVQEGITSVQDQMTGRIDRSVNVLEGANSKAAQFWQFQQSSYGSGTKTAAAIQFNAEFRPENLKTQNKATTDINESTNTLATDLRDSVQSLTGFGTSIGQAMKDLEQSTANLSYLRNHQDEDIKPFKDELLNTLKIITGRQTIEKEKEEIDQENRNNKGFGLANNIGGFGATLSSFGGALAYGASTALFTKFLNRGKSGTSEAIETYGKENKLYTGTGFNKNDKIFGFNNVIGKTYSKITSYLPDKEKEAIRRESENNILAASKDKEFPNEIIPFEESKSSTIIKLSEESKQKLSGTPSYSPIITSTPIVSPSSNLSEEQNLKIKKSLDRTLHLSPEELNKPFVHGGTTLTPNELSQLGVINIGQKEAGESTSAGLPAGKYPITYNTTQIKEQPNITPVITSEEPNSRFSSAGRLQVKKESGSFRNVSLQELTLGQTIIPGHEDLKGMHKKDINARLKNIYQEYTAKPEIPISSIVTATPVEKPQPIKFHDIEELKGKVIPISERPKLILEGTHVQTPIISPTLPPGAPEVPNFGGTVEPLKPIPRLTSGTAVARLAYKGGKLFSHAGVAGLALGLAGNATSNDTLATLGNVATIASFAPDLYHGGKAAIQYGKTAVGALEGIGTVGAIGGIAGAAGAGAAIGLTAGTYLNKARFAKTNNAIFSSSARGDVGDVAAFNAMLSQGESETNIQNYLQRHLSGIENQRKGVTGIFHTIAGQGQQREGFEQSSKVLQELLRQLPNAIAERDANKQDQTNNDAYNKKMSELLDAQINFFKNGGAVGSSKAASTIDSNIKVEIAIKDGDKASDAADKVISTIFGRLDDLKREIEKSNRNNGLTPQPATVNRT